VNSETGAGAEGYGEEPGGSGPGQSGPGDGRNDEDRAGGGDPSGAEAPAEDEDPAKGLNKGIGVFPIDFGRYSRVTELFSSDLDSRPFW